MHFCERDREVKNAICCFVSTNYSIMSLLLLFVVVLVANEP